MVQKYAMKKFYHPDDQNETPLKLNIDMYSGDEPILICCGLVK